MRKPTIEMRQHILGAAKSLMTEKGYTAVGLAEIVAAADVPKGSFYYYFKSKEEFGQALLEGYFDDYLSTIEGMLSGEGSASARLQAYFRFWADKQCTGLTDGKCLVVKLAPEMCDLSQDLREALKRGTDAIVERIAQCVRQGQVDGSIAATKPAIELAESLYQLWLGASLLDKLNHDGKSFEIALGAMAHLLS
ncbi:TetR/AcrR family transcriptional regulator [Paraburkholderia sp. BL25I1N1]|uniref:TetR/AcrR family transcriptional regulator n=1 Tax=Paraburkholderia sp. BL25I1N1 TaxID=1938804 RepID=UPI000D07621D|nr:TetR/AcrR family transcriptional regulator [Paraburkholderia sp. BL25I1N1]PRX96423.1 TetR family transcriptional regulator [Paraburkholderia sp. BL25I1N1]